MAASTADSLDPTELNGLRFFPAQVPGTIASALVAQRLLRPGDGLRFDSEEHWFRCRFSAIPPEPDEELVLQLQGIATIAEVWLNGVSVLQSNSMFARHELPVSALIQNENELLIVCRSLTSAMRERIGKKPPARWRTRVVSQQQLRWFRTTLLGRAPGFAPEPQPVGPWRPLALVRRCGVVLEHLDRQICVEGSWGVVETDVNLRVLSHGGRPVAGSLFVGEAHAPLEWLDVGSNCRARAVLRVPEVKLWWPHTYGEPSLYPVRLEVELADGRTVVFDDTPIGFRTLRPVTGNNGFAVILNGVSVFCRGVVWTPVDPVALGTPFDSTRQRLLLLRSAGINLIRVCGTTYYESNSFHQLCDELGFLVWQDMMFANFDYPFEDPAFHEAVYAEAQSELSRLSRHCSTTVVCGNSEVEQQVGMLGLDPVLGQTKFFNEELAVLTVAHVPDALYIPSAPSGGDLPFHTRAGVANYFGVGAYLRPMEDARRAEVPFASECLAFSNIPEPERMDQFALTVPGGLSPSSAAWKRGVPRDAGAGWDFEDVRDHYLRLLYNVDPAALRYSDLSRYWELSRMVSGEVMAEVFGEWRRSRSTCSGGIILWCADLMPGAGWGILDDFGNPKAAYYFLKRALAPVTIWTTDEGLNGIDIHVSNDSPSPICAVLRVALYRAGQIRIAEGHLTFTLPGQQTGTFSAEKILGRFVDASYAYRFGPPNHDLIAASLHSAEGTPPLAQSFRFPAGRPAAQIPFSSLGLTAKCRQLNEKTVEVTLDTRCFAWGVRVIAPGFMPDDAYFGLEPGVTRIVLLGSHEPSASCPAVSVTAVNAEDRITIPLRGSH